MGKNPLAYWIEIKFEFCWESAYLCRIKFRSIRSIPSLDFFFSNIFSHKHFGVFFSSCLSHDCRVQYTANRIQISKFIIIQITKTYALCQSYWLLFQLHAIFCVLFDIRKAIYHIGSVVVLYLKGFFSLSLHIREHESVSVFILYVGQVQQILKSHQRLVAQFNNIILLVKHFQSNNKLLIKTSKYFNESSNKKVEYLADVVWAIL